MKKCNACHADVDDDVEKCPMCGNDDFQTDDVEEMQEIPEGAKKPSRQSLLSAVSFL